MKEIIRTSKFDMICGLKGYAILFIFLIHVSNIFFKFPDFIYKIIMFSKYFVIVFFYLSAYTITKSILSNQKTFSFIRYMQRRFFRISLPYYAALLIAILFVLHTPININTIKDFVIHVFFINLNPLNYNSQASILGVEWTVSIQFWFYLLIPVFIYIDRYAIGIFLLSLFSLYLYFNPNIFFVYKGPFGYLWSIQIYVFTYILVTFLSTLGQFRLSGKNIIIYFLATFPVSVYLFIGSGRNSESLYLLSVFIIAVAGTYLSVSNFQSRISENLKNIFSQIMTVGLIIILIRYIQISYYIKNPVLFMSFWTAAMLVTSRKTIIHLILFQNPVIQFIGKISFSFYLIHFTVRNYFNNNFVLRNPYVESIEILITTIVISYLMYRFIEKPINIFSKNKFLKS
jgi:peptidoglycan/LPS O-acetylase OafA/YrhL